MAKFYDVSLSIKEGMVVYPNNPRPSIRRYSSIPRDNFNESLITIGSHTGTHLDSKLHIRNGADGVEAIPLDTFYGLCKVLNLTQIQKEIHRADLEEYPIERGDIVLLKTRNSMRGYKRFRADYVHLKLDGAEYLVKTGVKTLGFDYLSVKKYEEDDEVHNVLISNLTLFEGLNLAKVAEGEYTFIGLPLSIDCDGAPARVILVDDQTG